MDANKEAMVEAFRQLWGSVMRSTSQDDPIVRLSLELEEAATDVAVMHRAVGVAEKALEDMKSICKKNADRRKVLEKQVSARAEQISKLKAALKEARNRSVRIDTREIDPRSHNTVLSMDSFFQGIEDDSRYTEFAKALIQYLREQSVEIRGRRLYDVGTGPGLVLRELVNICTPQSYGGMDFSTSAIEHAKSILPDGNFMVGDIYKGLNLPEADLLFCSEVLEHLPKPAKALRSVLSAAVPGTTIVLTVPEGRVDCSRFHINFWSPESWESFIEDVVGSSSRWTTGLFKVYEKSAQGHNVAIIRV